LTANKIFRQRRKPIIMTLRPTIFDRDVTTLDIAAIF